jgi:hypothetical protein
MNIPALRRARLCTLAFVTVFCCVLTTPSQMLAQSASPIDLGRQSVPDLLGVVVGPSFHLQSGSFDTGCPCTFDGGAGNGIVLGLSYDRNLLTYGTAERKGTLWFGARLLFETRGVAALFREYEQIPVQSLALPEQRFTVPLQFRHRAEAQFSLLTLTPYVQWNPFGRLFVQAGLQGGLVIASRVLHTKELLDQSVRLPNGEVAQVRLRDVEGSVATVQDESPFPQTNAFQVALTLSGGYEIPIGNEAKYRLVPTLNYVLPLTTMSQSGADFRISAFQILLALKMNLERSN